MADDNRFRSNPPLGRGPAQAAPAHGGAGRNDPLAELARLIGQTDPFGELNKAPARPGSAAPARPAAAPRPQQPQVPQQRREAPSDPYGSPLQFNAQPFETRPRQDHRREDFQPAYDPAIYGSAAPQQPSEAYSDDPDLMHGEEVYEDEYEERPRRRVWVKVAMLLVVFGVIGGSGYVAYSALFGAPFGPPPVIKANTTPSKIAPTPSATEASNKQIYDRVGDASPQGERMVSREEKPVDVRDNSRAAPRMVGNALPGGGMSADASPPMSADPIGIASGEPKKIKTVTIRPEGTGSAGAPRQNAAPSSRQAAPAPSQGGGPLSLSPQGANAEASARQPFPAAPRQAAPQADPTRLAALPPATDIASGSYTVQISSQRSEAEAQSTFRSLQTKYPGILGDRQPIIRRADLGDRGIYYRALVGPFSSAEQATQFCGSLKSAGGQCVVQRN